MNWDKKKIDAEEAYSHLNVEEINNQLKNNAPLILDTSKTIPHHTDILYEKLELAGFDVKKEMNKNEAAIVVNEKH